MKHLLIALFLFTVLGANAQKKELLEEKEVILSRATEAMNGSLLPGTEMYEIVKKEGLIGKYVMQISFREKGDISSVFVVDASGHDIRSQNRFKDLLHQSELPFKTPKGRQYRIEHVFDLNTIQ